LYGCRALRKFEILRIFIIRPGLIQRTDNRPMRKILFVFTLLCASTCTYAQTLPTALTVAEKILPGFQLGFKAGTNLTSLSTSGTLNSDNRAGYLAGFYARIGSGGLQLQPEIYLTGKSVTLTDASGQSNSVNFTSIDVPILANKNFGVLGIGGRFTTGPVISFVVDKNQSLGGAFDKATHFDYKDQALAWQFGLGLDLYVTNLALTPSVKMVTRIPRSACLILVLG
jgi:hypothetical protein